jgi:hypothetical protein
MSASYTDFLFRKYIPLECLIFGLSNSVTLVLEFLGLTLFYARNRREGTQATALTFALNPLNPLNPAGFEALKQDQRTNPMGPSVTQRIRYPK